MIKLTRAEQPLYLTGDVVELLTEKFKNSRESVWNDDRIKVPLLVSSQGKCAYCECSVSEESKYMEVEHFRDKHSYPDLVVDWHNLLPSCKRCNGKKGGHDVGDVPIVNPYEDLPSDHLYYQDFRIKGRTEKGADTVDVIDLNNIKRAAIKRFEVGQAALESILSCQRLLSSYLVERSPRTRNRVSRHMEGILEECQPCSIYAATTATVVLNSADYILLKSEMVACGAWTDECERMDSIAHQIALPPTSMLDEDALV